MLTAHDDNAEWHPLLTESPGGGPPEKAGSAACHRHGKPKTPPATIYREAFSSLKKVGSVSRRRTAGEEGRTHDAANTE